MYLIESGYRITVQLWKAPEADKINKSGLDVRWREQPAIVR